MMTQSPLTLLTLETIQTLVADRVTDKTFRDLSKQAGAELVKLSSSWDFALLQLTCIK